MRTSTARHIRVTPRWRPTGCDTGVPWRGGGLFSALYENTRPHRGTPVSHPKRRPRGVTRMCRGVVVRVCSQSPPHSAAGISKPNRHCNPSYSRSPLSRPTIQCPRLTWRGACPKSWCPFWDTPASWREYWLHMRTTSPRHIRVTPRGRPTGCDTGVPWRGACIISALHEPATRTLAHPCHVPRAARGV